MAGEKPGSPDIKKAPPQAPVVVEGAPKAKPVEKPEGVKSEKTDIEVKKEAIKVETEELRKKRITAEEIVEGTKVYQDELFSLEGLDGPGVVPARPDQKMVKKEDFERSQKDLREQERRTAESIKSRMDAQLESVTRNGNINQLDPEDQKKIRTEIVITSIDPQSLPDDKKREILRTMKGPYGQPLDMSKVDINALTSSQKDFILNSIALRDLSSKAVLEYQKLQEQAQKNGQPLDKKVLDEFRKQYGLPNLDALNLSQIRPNMALSEYPSDSQIGIVQRVLSESTFRDLQDTLGKDMKWSHVPDAIKRELLLDSFSYDPAKNSTEVEKSLREAKTTVDNIKTERKEGESQEQFSRRIQETTGINTTDLDALSLEARKSGLSPFMRALADFFGPIGAALGIPFWQEYMGERLGSDDDFEDNGSDRWSSDAKGGKADIGKGVLRSNKGYLDNGAGLRLEGGSYEKQANNASEAIKANKERYMRVSAETGVPWELIGAIHFRESSLDFSKCLHNGDPLGRKTVRVPAGRGPFHTWEEAAIDALKMKGGLGFSEISQTNQLDQVVSYAEKYNGFGYRNKGVASAYVWAGTEAYTGGMYIADHVFSRTKKDPRPGVMAIITRLVPDVVKQKREPDTTTLASTVGGFSQEFQSAPFERSSTGTTLCSQTARKNLYKLLGRQEDIPRGDADQVHEIYRDGRRFGDMVGEYLPSFDPPKNANVADISLGSRSRYGHRVAAYKSKEGWMVLDPYNGGVGQKPQNWDSYVKKNNVRGVAFYQKDTTS